MSQKNQMQLARSATKCNYMGSCPLLSVIIGGGVQKKLLNAVSSMLLSAIIRGGVPKKN